MIFALIAEIEESISSSTIVLSSNIQKFFGSTKKEAYIRGNLIFLDLSCLEFGTYMLEKRRKVYFDKYRFQYMDNKKCLVFRYDNAPHYKNIATFPYHKHLHDGNVIESKTPQIDEILEEITAIIAQSTC